MIRRLWRWIWGEAQPNERTLLQRLHILLDFLAFWWHRATASRYLLHLEARVLQLEAQNRALNDTVYGLRGLPPLPAGPRVFVPQPAAMEKTPTLMPKAEPIMPKRAHTMMAQEIANRRREINQAGERKAEQIREELRKTIEEAQTRYEGLGFAVTEPGGEPVPIQELPVIPEGDNADVQK